MSRKWGLRFVKKIEKAWSGLILSEKTFCHFFQISQEPDKKGAAEHYELIISFNNTQNEEKLKKHINIWKLN